MSTTDFDLIIVGGGLAGASLAVALKDAALAIALVESRPPAPPPAGWDARVYAISPSSQRFLQSTGIWPLLDQQRINPVTDMAITGDAFARLRFSAYDCGVDALAQIAEAGRLLAAHWQLMRRQANLTLLCPATPTGLELPGAGLAASTPQASPAGDEGVATLILSDGRRLTARLIVGADGRDSPLRSWAGLTADQHPYDEFGVVANFRAERDHRGTAFQWFRDDGILAWLPLPDRHVSMVWSCRQREADMLLAMSPEHLADAVGGAGADRLGLFATVTPATAFPLKRIDVAQTVAPRCVLIGDAAHGVHPLSGHGINLGFADARELSRLIAGVVAGGDVGNPRLLDAYRRTRQPETFLIGHGTHALHQLFCSSLPGLSLLRNLGLNLTDHAGPVKSLLARVAMG